MNYFTHLSKHALDRIEQRTSIGMLEMARILDCQLFVSIGRTPGFTKEHRLFYSIHDEAHFVAIQDYYTGEVITVLPIEYHENLAWKVNESDLSTAKHVVLNPPDEYESYGKKEIHPKTPASIYIISAHFVSEDGVLKSKDIAKIKPKTHVENVSELLKNTPQNSDLAKWLDSSDIISSWTPASVFSDIKLHLYRR